MRILWFLQTLYSKFSQPLTSQIRAVQKGEQHGNYEEGMNNYAKLNVVLLPKDIETLQKTCPSPAHKHCFLRSQRGRACCSCYHFNFFFSFWALHSMMKCISLKFHYKILYSCSGSLNFCQAVCYKEKIESTPYVNH